METRAHFIIIGLFTIGGILGALGFFIWLASVQIDRQYTRYGVLFENVSGLDQSADVLFNGVSVGRVTGIRIWENDPRLVYVAIEVDAATPISVNTVAQLESQGVTGVAYIALAGGSPDGARLTGTPDAPPIIASRRSTLQSLVNSAPDILNDAADLMAQLQAITGQENQDYVRGILQNVEAATAELDTALADFAEISTTVKDATAQITVFTDRLDQLSAAAETTLTNVDQTLESVTATFDAAGETVTALRPAIAKADAAFAAMDMLITETLTPLSDQLSGTLTQTDAALASAEQAFSRADGIMAQDVGPALSDLQEAVSAVSGAATAIATDGPAALADIRGVVADIDAAVTAATPGLRDFGRLGAEARNLVRGLDDLVRQISRDPARFLLNERVPEYRR